MQDRLQQVSEQIARAELLAAAAADAQGQADSLQHLVDDLQRQSAEHQVRGRARACACMTGRDVERVMSWGLYGAMMSGLVVDLWCE